MFEEEEIKPRKAGRPFGSKDVKPRKRRKKKKVKKKHYLNITKYREKTISTKHLAAVRAGKVLSPETTPTSNKATNAQMEERLLFCADLLRKNHAREAVALAASEKFGMSLSQCRKYVRKIYKEFSEAYEPEDRNAIMAEHLEALKHGMKICLEVEDMANFEKISRQYAECNGLIQKVKVTVDNVDNRQQTVNTQVNQNLLEGAKKDTLSALMDLTNDNFAQQFTGSRQPNTSGEETTGPNDSRPETLLLGS